MVSRRRGALLEAQASREDEVMARRRVEDKRDVHVHIPESICARIEALAAAENRTFPRQLATLLETHPALIKK